jgi:hypothetical protein
MRAAKTACALLGCTEICYVLGLPIASSFEDIPRNAPRPKKNGPARPRVQRKKAAGLTTGGVA